MIMKLHVLSNPPSGLSARSPQLDQVCSLFSASSSSAPAPAPPSSLVGLFCLELWGALTKHDLLLKAGLSLLTSGESSIGITHSRRESSMGRRHGRRESSMRTEKAWSQARELEEQLFHRTT